jgi:hypothetical protein
VRIPLFCCSQPVCCLFFSEPDGPTQDNFKFLMRHAGRNHHLHRLPVAREPSRQFSPGVAMAMIAQSMPLSVLRRFQVRVAFAMQRRKCRHLSHLTNPPGPKWITDKIEWIAIYEDFIFARSNTYSSRFLEEVHLPLIFSGDSTVAEIYS